MRKLTNETHYLSSLHVITLTLQSHISHSFVILLTQLKKIGITTDHTLTFLNIPLNKKKLKMKTKVSPEITLPQK